MQGINSKGNALSGKYTISVVGSEVNVNKFYELIGDTINDIGLGVNAGITSIGVTWGYNSRKLLTTAGATHLVNNANDLGKLMKTIFA